MNTDPDTRCIFNAAFGFAQDCTGAVAGFPALEYEWIFWFSLANSAAVVVLAILRLPYLIRRPVIKLMGRNPTLLLAAKLITGTTYVGLHLGLLVVVIRHTKYQTTRLVASTVLKLVSSCALFVLSPLEHFKSLCPSVLVCSYLFLALVSDLTRCPLIWHALRYYGIDDAGSDDWTAFTALFTAVIVVEFIFLVLESVQRTRWLVWEAANHSPEETSSILNLGLYAWLNPLLWRGYHEPLTMPHLFPLDRAISVATFDAQDPSGLEKNHSTETSIWSLFSWLITSLGQYVLLPVFPRLCLLGFTFCQPFFLQRLLSFLASREDPSSGASELIVVATFIYSGIAISTALYWYCQERFQSLLRAFLISAIYRKTAHVACVGDGDSAAVTLMGADVERIYTGLRFVHEVWASTIQVALAAWFLQRQIGLAFFAPLVIVLLGFAASFALSRRAVPYQGAWMTRVQRRVSFTSAVLTRVKDLRVSGMTALAATLLQREREDEIQVGERSRVLTAVSASLSQLPQAVAPALAFALGPHILDETRAFTALSFLALLTAPLIVLLQSLPIIAACVACLQRIRAFLSKNGRVDERCIGPGDNHCSNAEKLDTSQEAFVIVKDGNFGWTAESTVLTKINICLPRSSITFVVGPIASGKSTLCRALLGEIPYAQGTVALRSDRLGYCDQTPFLVNASIKANIVGFSSFGSSRYADVLQATMLAEDLRSLPAGDSTNIGTKGISLSGGQRQRVSLARALYHDADILVLDDILSGLDGTTQELICQSVFGPDGLLRRRGTTTILCTHSTHFLPAADYILALSSQGTIADYGSFTEIAQDKQRARRVGISCTSNLKVGSEKLDMTTSEIGVRAKEESISTINVPITQPQPASTPTPTLTPTIDLVVYRYWLSAIGLLPLVFYVVLVTGNGFFSNFPNIWLKIWSADSVSRMPQHSFAFWIGIYALLGVGVVLCVFPAGLVMLRTAVRLTGTDLHRTTVDTVMHSSLRFLSSTDVGKVLNLFSQDTNIMDTQLPRMVNNLCFCLANAIGQAVVIASSSAWLVISYPFFIAVLWVVQRVYLPTSKRLRILDLEAKSPL